MVDRFVSMNYVCAITFFMQDLTLMIFCRHIVGLTSNDKNNKFIQIVW